MIRLNLDHLTMCLPQSIVILLCVYQVQAQSCHCDFSNIAGSCDCTDLPVRSLEEISVIYPELCPVDAVIHSLHFSSLNQLENISGSNRKPSNCSWEDVFNLTLSNISIHRLQSDSFLSFSHLTWLNVSHNSQLNSYGNGAFHHLGRHLKTLILKSNPVRSLTKNVFEGMETLSSLILSENKIGYIETGVFSQNCCSNIRELRLDRNILTVLDADSLIGLSSLEILDLRNNPLQQLESTVFLPCAITLTELYMSHNDQTSFGGFETPEPGLFASLNRLTMLHIEELKIKNLTKNTFRGLTNLRELSLRGNRLIQLPPDVFSSLRKLESLDLSANWLICISSSLNPEEQADFLSGLNLRKIDLSWNRLTHLNHLTASSLGLFDTPYADASRLVLNLTANPWQQIDEDTFCHPNERVLIRPTDLILGPVPTIPFGVWRTSLGLWHARITWPYGPLSLIGPSSRVFGMMLEEKDTERLSPTSQEETPQFNFKFGLVGANDALERCHELKARGYSTGLNNSTNNSTLPVGLKDVRRPSATLIAFSLSSYCPRLPIHKLENWELSRLKVSKLIDAYDPFSGSPLRAIEEGSRLYLLVIVGVCITFLLIALTVIMCYRAWSKRTSQKCVENGLEGCPTALTLEGNTEKHLLLRNQVVLVNGEGKNSFTRLGDDKSHGDRRTLRSSHCTTTPVTNGSAISDISLKPVVPPSDTAIDASFRTNSHPTRGHLRTGRPKSDSDANSIDDTNQLTAFGVV